MKPLMASLACALIACLLCAAACAEAAKGKPAGKPKPTKPKPQPQAARIDPETAAIIANFFGAKRTPHSPSSGGAGVSAAGDNDACFKATYGRGAGTPVDTCPSGMQKIGALCYPPCRDGYSGFLSSCFRNCPGGYSDQGALCSRPPHIYGKGCCCIRFFNIRRCCGNCPSGYNDDGCTCHRYAHTFAKDSYIRGQSPMNCGSKQYDNGLCYRACRPGFNGVGPVCWASGAPSDFPVRCNDIGWGGSQAACKEMNEVFATMGIYIGTGLTACISAIVAALASGGVLTPIPAAVCPVAMELIINGIAEGIKLGKYSVCPN